MTEVAEPQRVAAPLEASDAIDVSRLAAWGRRQDPVRWVLALMVVGWAVLFFVLCKLRHDRFATFAFDLGTYDQAVWLLAHGKMFDTVRGLDVLGHHMNLVLLVLAPFYRLGAGVEFLLLVQIASQASGAVAIYLLARDRLADRWLAVVMAGVLLLNPTYQFLAWEYFHPDTLAIAPLLFAYWAARAHRWRWFAVAAVLAVLCKEDVALAIAAMGVLIAWKEKRRIGIITAVAATLWWLLATRVLIGFWLDGQNPFYDTFFGDLGDSFGEVLVNIVLRPGTTFDLATRTDRLEYYQMMLTPVAFLPLASASTLLIALPMLAVNVLTTFPYARDYLYHYSAIVLAGVMLATVEGIARLGRSPSTRRFLVGLTAAAALASTVAWGPSPISVQYQRGYWPPANDPRIEVQREAVAVVPDGVPLAATYSQLPHLSHREKIYNFPEPWRRVDWGVAGEGLHDPNGVEWMVVDRRVLNSQDVALVDWLVSSGQFVPRYERDDMLVAERVDTGGPFEPPT